MSVPRVDLINGRQMAQVFVCGKCGEHFVHLVTLLVVAVVAAVRVSLVSLLSFFSLSLFFLSLSFCFCFSLSLSFSISLSSSLSLPFEKRKIRLTGHTPPSDVFFWSVFSCFVLFPVFLSRQFRPCVLLFLRFLRVFFLAPSIFLFSGTWAY